MIGLLRSITICNLKGSMFSMLLAHLGTEGY